jgi:hypothetical protein
MIVMGFVVFQKIVLKFRFAACAELHDAEPAIAIAGTGVDQDVSDVVV